MAINLSVFAAPLSFNYKWAAKNQIITLTGMSGSGKTYLKDRLMQDYHFAEIVSTTTRPKRQGEREGVDYYFISEDDFKENIKEGRMMEFTCFQGNYYGVSRQELLEKSNLGMPLLLITEPSGVVSTKAFAKDNKIELTSFFLDITPEDAIDRVLKRENNASGANKSREKSIQGEEQKWCEMLEYDIMIPYFNEHNEAEVVKQIVDQFDPEPKGTFFAQFN